MAERKCWRCNGTGIWVSEHRVTEPCISCGGTGQETVGDVRLRDAARTRQEVSALGRELRDLRTVFRTLLNKQDRTRNRRGIQLHAQMQKVHDRLIALEEQSPDDYRRLRSELNTLTDALMKEIFMLPPRLPGIDAVAELDLSIKQTQDELKRAASLPHRERERVGMDVHLRLRRALWAACELEAQGHNMDSVRRRLQTLTRKVLTDIFDLPAEEVDSQMKEAPVAPARNLLTVACQPALTKQFVNDDYASVEYSLSYGSVQYTVEGHAKRDPEDMPNQALGLTLATGRALRKLGNDLVNQANRAVTEADKERRRTEAKKAQARSVQRKAQSKIQQEADALAEAARLRDELRKAEKAAADLVATVEQQSETIGEFHRLEEQRKERAYKQRIATRKANASKKAAVKAPAKRARAKV